MQSESTLFTATLGRSSSALQHHHAVWHLQRNRHDLTGAWATRMRTGVRGDGELHHPDNLTLPSELLLRSQVLP